MPGFIKSKSDEATWKKAKHAAKAAGADNKYAFANWWFHQRKESTEEETTELAANRIIEQALTETTLTGMMAAPTMGVFRPVNDEDDDDNESIPKLAFDRMLKVVVKKPSGILG